MNLNPHRVMTAFFVGLFFINVTIAQENTKKPQTLRTETKVILSILKVNEHKIIKISGKAFYTLTAGNTDDSFTGRLTYTLSAESHRQIAKAFHPPLKLIPTSITQEDIIVTFQKGAKCPLLRFEFIPMKLSLHEWLIQFDSFNLEIKETRQDISKILCTLARRANGQALGRGPLRRFNELLYGEAEKD